MKKQNELAPEMDPRNMAYYLKAFPKLSSLEREELRADWIVKNTSKMTKMDAADFDKLKWGDSVWVSNGGDMSQFRYVGRMPGSAKNYFIFSSGETLKHLYINKSKGHNNYNQFRGEWYKGEYCSYLCGALQIKRNLKNIKSISEIYFNED